jgi:hypothetical protein
LDLLQDDRRIKMYNRMLKEIENKGLEDEIYKLKSTISKVEWDLKNMKNNSIKTMKQAALNECRKKLANLLIKSQLGPEIEVK